MKLDEIVRGMMLALCFLMKLDEIVRGMMLALCFLMKLDEIVRGVDAGSLLLNEA